MPKKFRKVPEGFWKGSGRFPEGIPEEPQAMQKHNAPEFSVRFPEEIPEESGNELHHFVSTKVECLNVVSCRVASRRVALICPNTCANVH